MIYGTHNSATGGQLLRWLRSLAWIINPTSKCQDRTIADQLADGVKVFNLQVAYYKGRWRFSHGLALYEEDIFEVLAMMKATATKDEPIYFQLYLDRCFWCKQDIFEFEKLVMAVNIQYCGENLKMLSALVEGGESKYSSDIRIDLTEHYWTLSWAKVNAKYWLDKIPLPRRHARLHNAEYKKNCKTEYLMLDFYDIK